MLRPKRPLIAFSINMIRRVGTGAITFWGERGVRKAVQNLSVVQILVGFTTSLSRATLI